MHPDFKEGAENFAKEHGMRITWTESGPYHEVQLWTMIENEEERRKLLNELLRLAHRYNEIHGDHWIEFHREVIPPKKAEEEKPRSLYTWFPPEKIEEFARDLEERSKRTSNKELKKVLEYYAKRFRELKRSVEEHSQ